MATAARETKEPPPMPCRTAVSAFFLIIAAPALAQEAAGPETATRSFDTSRASGSTTITRNDGDVSRDSQVTRKSDGASLTSSRDRTRDDSGFSSSATRTGFDGRTATRSYDRSRTETGFTESGSVTGRGGRSYTLDGSRSRTGSGFTRNRQIRTDEGRILASRDVEVTRDNGQISRSVAASGPQRLLTRRDNRAGRRIGRRG
jgi:hypothetical protein